MDNKPEIQRISKKLVHKHLDDNVFVAYLRRELPFEINTDCVEQTLLPLCSHGEKELLLRHYSRKTKPARGKQRSREYYCRNDLPATISTETARQLIHGHDIRFFLKFYRRKASPDQFQLTAHPDEIETVRLNRLLSAGKKMISSSEKQTLSELLDRAGCNTSHPYTYYANLVIDTEHPFFFEHPNEHVPGMMLIESVRQFLIACSHQFGNVPLEGYAFILSSITVHFKNYLELNFPVLFKVVFTECHQYETGIWADVIANVQIFQNENETATMAFQCNIATKRVFNRLRNTKIPARKQSWFLLRHEVEYRILLRYDAGEKVYATLEYIAHDACVLKLTGTLPETFHVSQPLEIIMYFSKIGFVQGFGVANRLSNYDDFSLIHFKFTDIHNNDRHNLNDVIKKYCFYVESETIA